MADDGPKKTFGRPEDGLFGRALVDEQDPHSPTADAIQWIWARIERTCPLCELESILRQRVSRGAREDHEPTSQSPMLDSEPAGPGGTQLIAALAQMNSPMREITHELAQSQKEGVGDDSIFDDKGDGAPTVGAVSSAMRVLSAHAAREWSDTLRKASAPRQMPLPGVGLTPPPSLGDIREAWVSARESNIIEKLSHRIKDRVKQGKPFDPFALITAQSDVITTLHPWWRDYNKPDLEETRKDLGLDEPLGPANIASRVEMVSMVLAALEQNTWVPDDLDEQDGSESRRMIFVPRMNKEGKVVVRPVRLPEPLPDSAGGMDLYIETALMNWWDARAKGGMELPQEDLTQDLYRRAMYLYTAWTIGASMAQLDGHWGGRDLHDRIISDGFETALRGSPLSNVLRKSDNDGNIVSMVSTDQEYLQMSAIAFASALAKQVSTYANEHYDENDLSTILAPRLATLRAMYLSLSKKTQKLLEQAMQVALGDSKQARGDGVERNMEEVGLDVIDYSPELLLEMVTSDLDGQSLVYETRIVKYLEQVYREAVRARELPYMVDTWFASYPHDTMEAARDILNTLHTLQMAVGLMGNDGIPYRDILWAIRHGSYYATEEWMQSLSDEQKRAMFTWQTIKYLLHPDEDDDAKKALVKYADNYPEGLEDIVSAVNMVTVASSSAEEGMYQEIRIASRLSDLAEGLGDAVSQETVVVERGDDKAEYTVYCRSSEDCDSAEMEKRIGQFYEITKAGLIEYDTQKRQLEAVQERLDDLRRFLLEGWKLKLFDENSKPDCILEELSGLYESLNTDDDMERTFLSDEGLRMVEERLLRTWHRLVKVAELIKMNDSVQWPNHRMNEAEVNVILDPNTDFGRWVDPLRRKEENRPVLPSFFENGRLKKSEEMVWVLDCLWEQAMQECDHELVGVHRSDVDENVDTVRIVIGIDADGQEITIELPTVVFLYEENSSMVTILTEVLKRRRHLMNRMRKKVHDDIVRLYSLLPMDKWDDIDRLQKMMASTNDSNGEEGLTPYEKRTYVPRRVNDIARILNRFRNIPFANKDIDPYAWVSNQVLTGLDDLPQPVRFELEGWIIQQMRDDINWTQLYAGRRDASKLRK